MESYKTLQRQKCCPPLPSDKYWYWLFNQNSLYCSFFFQGGCTWDEPYPDEIGLNIEEKKRIINSVKQPNDYVAFNNNIQLEIVQIRREE